MVIDTYIHMSVISLDLYNRTCVSELPLCFCGVWNSYYLASLATKCEYKCVCHNFSGPTQKRQNIRDPTSFPFRQPSQTVSFDLSVQSRVELIPTLRVRRVVQPNGVHCFTDCPLIDNFGYEMGKSGDLVNKSVGFQPSRCRVLINWSSSVALNYYKYHIW